MKRILKGLGARIGRFSLLFVPPNDRAASARSLILTRLANAAEDLAGRAFGFVGIANVFEGSDSEESWIQIAPLGDFPHALGLQRVDRKAVEAMANHFNSLRTKLANRFGGVPFYVGHPDVPGIGKEYPDKRAYGWVREVEARGDGLYGRVKWSEPGRAMLANAHYKFFSPFWNAESAVEGGKKILRPVELLSVGLTNQPNLPVNPLANEGARGAGRGASERDFYMTREQLINALGLANTATDKEIETRLAAMVAASTALANAQAERATAATALANEQESHKGTKSNLELQLANARQELASHKSARIELMVDNAIREGRVPVANRAQWIADLDKDFVNKSALLASEKPAMKTGAKTADQGNRRADATAIANERDRREQVQALMNEKMANGLSYDVAWSQVQRENPDLFKQMVTPEAAN